MFIDREAGSFLRGLMSSKGYSVRQLAHLTGKLPTQIQRLRNGNVRQQDDSMEPLFSVLPEFKEFLARQQEQKIDDLFDTVTDVSESTEHTNGMSVIRAIGAAVKKYSMCPVLKEWQVLEGDWKCETQAGAPEPYAYTGNAEQDGLYAFQLEHKTGEPLVPYKAIVYALRNESPAFDRLHLFVFDEQPVFGHLYRQTAKDTYLFIDLSNKQVTINVNDLRGRVIGWTVLA